MDWAVDRGLAGVECLSGIPGSVGGAPIQNIGAYGQDVSQTVVAVRAWDREGAGEVEIPAERCGFGYRSSRFKEGWAGRFVVLSVRFRLRPGPPDPPRHGELERRLGGRLELRALREAVLALRRGKGMVVDPEDPDSRSAGSFFTNPVLSSDEAEAVARRAALLRDEPLPRWPAGRGRVKVPAAFLIEASGIQKGEGLGGAAISSRHTLAIVNRGGATAADVVGLAGRVRRRVRDAFSVTLVPEPRFVGFDRPVDRLLEEGL